MKRHVPMSAQREQQIRNDLARGSEVEWSGSAVAELLDEIVFLRAALAAAQRDTARLAQLESLIVADDLLGDVTLSASASPPMRTVHVYLGQSIVPAGVGETLGEAIDVASPSTTEPM